MVTVQNVAPQFQQDMCQFAAYLENEKNASDSTVASYQRDLKKLFLFLDNRGVECVKDITATSLNSYILQMERDGFSTSSVSRSIASIRAFCHFLQKTKVTEEDPSGVLKAPHVEKKTPEVLTWDEVIRLLEQPDIKNARGLKLFLQPVRKALRCSHDSDAVLADIHRNLPPVIFILPQGAEKRNPLFS